MKVTVIIGAYNVSHFLKEKRLSCILNQTYQNLEIILVNDGSTDNTGALCDELQKQDSRIHVIHKENGGLGSARNAGLELATGDYIWFYDVDDETSLELIEKNIKIVSQHNVDLCVFGFDVVIEATNECEKISFNKQLITTNAELKAAYMDVFVYSKHGNGFNWNKFYNREFLNKHKIRFGDQRIQQDEVFNIQLYPKLERVYIMPDALYEYSIVTTGNTRSRYIADRLDIFMDIHQKLSHFSNNWLDRNEEYLNIIDNRLYNGLVNVLEFNLNHSDCPLSLRQRLAYMKKALENNQVNKVINSDSIVNQGRGAYGRIVSYLLKNRLTVFLYLLFNLKKLIIEFRR